MRKFKRVLVAGTATTMLLGSVLNVSAAGLRDIFDAKYYADSYSDLKETFGYDENQLYYHFITYGLKEGRNMSPILDVVAYREAYGDLNEAFGDNWDAYVNHFLDYGASEMRDKGVLFNPVVYADAYGDIKTAYGSDLMAIARHYLTFGKSENRTLGTSNGYADMATAKVAQQAAQQAAQKAEKPGKPSVTWSSWGGRTEYEYDSLGNCIAEIYYDAAGNRESYTESVYDGKKRQKWTQYDGDGNVTSYSTHEWDGNKVKISHYDASGNPDGYTDCETDSHFNFTRGLNYDREGKLINSYVQTFDGDDNVLTATYYDADGNEYSNTSYTYYENGIIKTVIYIETSIEGRFSVMEYNENGSLVSSRTYSDEKLGYEATYEYSAEGPVTKCCSVSYREDGSVSFKCDTEYAADGGYTYSSEDYDSDGILWNKSIEVYNAQNEQVRGITYNFNNDGRVSYKCVTEYASDGGYASSWEKYDSDGVLISKHSDAYNAQKEQVKGIEYHITDGEVSAVSVSEYENGRIMKRLDYEADGETLITTVTYTYEKKDYGYDRICRWVGTSGLQWQYNAIDMYDANDNYLGYWIQQDDGTVVENWTSEGKTKYYHADGKLYREEIKDASWTTVAAYEYEYDADGNQIVFELVKNENGKWVRPSENPGTDEPGTDAPGAADPGTDEPGTDAPGAADPGTDEPGGSVSGGDADPGSVSGGDAASSVSGNDAAGN